MTIVYIVAGVVLVLAGIAILIFRVQYAAWWNRVYQRRNQRETFTVVLSIVYGVVAMVAGLALASIGAFSK